MKPGLLFAQERLAQVREVCQSEGCVAALYAFVPNESGEYHLAALFSKTLAWSGRLDLELAIAEALGLENVELIDLKRMPLVFRFNVIDQGNPIYVGQPEQLAVFIEQTIARYAAFYPLLEALYWTVETRPLAEDQLAEGSAALP
ncbi:MAG: hypothetical protein M8467_15310 [Anaerolineae bacterium]|nr:hypothetical protein [Anaerolineae bacterium]